MKPIAALAAAAGIVLAFGPSAHAAVTSDLAAPDKKEIANQILSSNENSSLDWRAQYRYIEDIRDGRGYTAGTVGFTTGTGDLLQLVRAYTASRKKNPLRRYLGALKRVNGSDSHDGLRGFVKAWKKAARDPVFQAAQDAVRDRLYFDPAVGLAKADGLNALGQFCYYDAAVVHGFSGAQAIRRRALARVPLLPSAGGDEAAYLSAFLDERRVEMLKEKAHSNSNLQRVDLEQRRFLTEGNLDLHLPLAWTVNTDPFVISG